MTVGSLLLSIALFLIVIVVVARPFFRPLSRPTPLSKRELLEAQREALTARLDALDFDAQTDKQDSEAYQAERQLILNARAKIEGELSELQPDDVDVAIENALAELRRRNQPVAPTNSSPPQFCTHCGRATVEGDRFCAGCGRELA